jgi:hypothetical protein
LIGAIMPFITDDIRISLDTLAANLFAQGLGQATLSIHDEMEKTAQRYAAAIGVEFGGAYPNIPIGNPNRSLLVFRDGKSLFPSTSGPLLYDHCWMIYYNILASHVLPRTATPLMGYLCRCELVMESEMDFAENVSEYKSNEFHKDFQKIITAKASFKVFIFRSQSEATLSNTVSDLETQIYCVENGGTVETYLLSCWCRGKFFHHEFMR